MVNLTSSQLNSQIIPRVSTRSSKRKAEGPEQEDVDPNVIIPKKRVRKAKVAPPRLTGFLLKVSQTSNVGNETAGLIPRPCTAICFMTLPPAASIPPLVNPPSVDKTIPVLYRDVVHPRLSQSLEWVTALNEPIFAHYRHLEQQAAYRPQYEYLQRSPVVREADRAAMVDMIVSELSTFVCILLFTTSGSLIGRVATFYDSKLLQY